MMALDSVLSGRETVGSLKFFGKMSFIAHPYYAHNLFDTQKSRFHQFPCSLHSQQLEILHRRDGGFNFEEMPEMRSGEIYRLRHFFKRQVKLKMILHESDNDSYSPIHLQPPVARKGRENTDAVHPR